MSIAEIKKAIKGMPKRELRSLAKLIAEALDRPGLSEEDAELLQQMKEKATGNTVPLTDYIEKLKAEK